MFSYCILLTVFWVMYSSYPGKFLIFFLSLSLKDWLSIFDRSQWIVFCPGPFIVQLRCQSQALCSLFGFTGVVVFTANVLTTIQTLSLWEKKNATANIDRKKRYLEIDTYLLPFSPIEIYKYLIIIITNNL